MNNQNNQQKLPSLVELLTRGLVALYLLYMAFQMIKREDMSNPRIFIVICAVLFAIIGIIMLVAIMRRFIKGEYESPNADSSQEIESDSSSAKANEAETEHESISDEDEVKN